MVSRSGWHRNRGVFTCSQVTPVIFPPEIRPPSDMGEMLWLGKGEKQEDVSCETPCVMTDTVLVRLNRNTGKSKLLVAWGAGLMRGSPSTSPPLSLSLPDRVFEWEAHGMSGCVHASRGTHRVTTDTILLRLDRITRAAWQDAMGSGSIYACGACCARATLRVKGGISAVTQTSLDFERTINGFSEVHGRWVVFPCDFTKWKVLGVPQCDATWWSMCGAMQQYVTRCDIR